MVPEGWKKMSVGQCIKFEGGTQPPKNVFISRPQDGYVRLIQTRDFKTDKFATYIPKELAKNSFTKEDIMIGRYGPPVFQIYKGKSGAYNVALIKATPFSGVDRDYAFYFLKGEMLYRQIDALSRRSAGQAGVEMDFLKSYPMPLPPLAEQKKIAEILSTWDRAIEVAEAQLSAAQSAKRALMQQLLTGKRRFPEFQGEEWKEVRFDQVFQRVRRKNTVGNENTLTISGQDGLVSQQEYFNKRVAAADLSGYTLLVGGDFAYNKSYSSGYPMGAIKMLPDGQSGVVSSLYLCFVIENAEAHDREFFRHFFEAGCFNREIYKIAQEGARNHGLLNVSVHDFFKTKLVVPSLAEQVKIAETLNLAELDEERQQRALTKLRSEKKALMQQLLTGKRRVVV